MNDKKKIVVLQGSCCQHKVLDSFVLRCNTAGECPEVLLDYLALLRYNGKEQFYNIKH